jgi:hypothetical protein
MPRPKKVEATVPEKEVAKDEGLVTLRHFAKGGRVFIGGEIYPIEDGYIKVKPEHLAKAIEHIKLGG